MEWDEPKATKVFSQEQIDKYRRSMLCLGAHADEIAAVRYIKVTIPNYEKADVKDGVCFDQEVARCILTGDWSSIRDRSTQSTRLRPTPPAWREQISISDYVVPSGKRAAQQYGSEFEGREQLPTKMKALKVDDFLEPSDHKGFPPLNSTASRYTPPKEPATLANSSRRLIGRPAKPLGSLPERAPDPYVRSTDLKHQSAVMKGRLEKLEKEAKDLKATMMQRSWR